MQTAGEKRSGSYNRSLERKFALFDVNEGGRSTTARNFRVRSGIANGVAGGRLARLDAALISDRTRDSNPRCGTRARYEV